MDFFVEEGRDRVEIVLIFGAINAKRQSLRNMITFLGVPSWPRIRAAHTPSHTCGFHREHGGPAHNTKQTASPGRPKTGFVSSTGRGHSGRGPSFGLIQTGSLELGWLLALAVGVCVVFRHANTCSIADTFQCEIQKDWFQWCPESDTGITYICGV